jgi:hypothetical protein
MVPYLHEEEEEEEEEEDAGKYSTRPWTSSRLVHATPTIPNH